jgi:ribosomal protein S18 acetylase RimI-like enzyme
MEVREATPADAEVLGRLMHDFSTEYDDFTPGPAKFAERFRELLAGEETAALLAGEDGLVVLRFRPSLYSPALECYLAELYVAPAKRGQGLGRQLMDAAIELARGRGADYMDLATSEDDVAARALYERSGFRNREGGDHGPVMYCYEREL